MDQGNGVRVPSWEMQGYQFCSGETAKCKDGIEGSPLSNWGTLQGWGTHSVPSPLRGGDAALFLMVEKGSSFGCFH